MQLRENDFTLPAVRLQIEALARHVGHLDEGYRKDELRGHLLNLEAMTAATAADHVREGMPVADALALVDRRVERFASML